MASAGTKTVLITANSNDFCKKDSEDLHQQLVEDLQGAGLPSDSISVCRSISQFNEKHILSALKSVKVGGSSVDKDWNFKDFSLLRFFNEEIGHFIDHIRDIGDELSDDIGAALLSNIDICRVYLAALHEPTDVVAKDVVATSDETVATIIHFRSLGDWHADIYKADFHFLEHEEGIYIVERDLNSHMMTVGFEMEIDFTLDLTLESDSGKCLESFISFMELVA